MKMKSITVISGKGGTGKTSICAAFATIAQNAVFADCDVDASDLHIIFDPENIYKEFFSASEVASIDESRCSNCELCVKKCRFQAITEKPEIIDLKCEGCGVCYHVCPQNAITMKKRDSGLVKVGKTRFGMLFEGSLFPGEGLSGKLVALIRKKAYDYAKENNKDMIIVDGSPGIGCPVIASISGVDAALIVTEPTLSGVHDMFRVLEVCSHFKIEPFVLINKYDLNENIAKRIEMYCNKKNTQLVGKISYDDIFSKALIQKRSVIEYDPGSKIAHQIKNIWRCINDSCN